MKTAACLFSFDRPEYLKETIKSLKANTLFDSVDWFLFQDNPMVPETGNTTGNTQNCIKCFHEYILPFPNPNTTITTFNRNRGIPRMKLAAHKLTQDSYDWIFFFEDDMIVSPYYMGLVLNMAKRYGPGFVYSACDLRLEVLQSNISKDSDVNLSPFMNLVGIGLDSHAWGHLYHSSVVKHITPALQDYSDFIGPDYKRRNHDEIRKKYNMQVTSHDRLIEVTARKHGIEKMNTVVPRARYIGERGLHATPKFYQKNGFDKKWNFVFDEDRKRENFTLIQ